jgi:hypothetical protein
MQSVSNTVNIPGEVIRILASHGPLQVVTQAPEGATTATAAPFEDVLHLFLSPASATVSALLRSSRVEISANAADGSYHIHMEGRAHAGRRLAGHPQLSILEPWQPEDVAANRLVVVPFVAERITFVRGEGDSGRRNAGLTPAGTARASQGRIWVAAAFSGMAGPLALWFVLAAAFWFGVQGAEFLGRPLALGFSLISGLGLIAGTRLLVIARGFLQWRRQCAAREDAPFLSEGLLAPREATVGGIAILVLGFFMLFPLWSIWGPDLMWRVVIASGVWLCGPAWALHLAMGRPEPRR